MANQPVVVQRQDDGNAAACQLVDDRRGQAGQVMDVRDVGTDRIDDL